MADEASTTTPVTKNQEPVAEQPKKAQDQQPEESTAEVHEVKSGSKNSYLVAIAVAVLFAIALIGFGIVAFGDDNTQTSTENAPTNTGLALPVNEQASQAEEVDLSQPVSEQDLSEEINQIDAAIEALDEADFDSSDLSDEALGL